MILTFLDIETTGLKLDQHEIIEFGAMRIELDSRTLKFNSLDSYSLRIKPLHIARASDFALKLNGYTGEKWAKAIHPRESIPLMKGLIENTDILVGQNLIFDLRFIKKVFKKYKSSVLFPKYLDTKQMAEDSGEENTSLEGLCTKYNVQFNGDAHTALVDCDRTYKVFKELLQRSVPTYFTFSQPFQSERKHVQKNF
jgi:DNA polymerase III epsilon subunit-like protein